MWSKGASSQGGKEQFPGNRGTLGEKGQSFSTIQSDNIFMVKSQEQLSVFMSLDFLILDTINQIPSKYYLSLEAVVFYL